MQRALATLGIRIGSGTVVGCVGLGLGSVGAVHAFIGRPSLLLVLLVVLLVLRLVVPGIASNQMVLGRWSKSGS